MIAFLFRHIFVDTRDSLADDSFCSCHVVDGVTHTHQFLELRVTTPLETEKMRGRTVGVTVCTLDGLLPGMLRYMRELYKCEKREIENKKHAGALDVLVGCYHT